MIITRLLARQLRSVLRRAGIKSSPRDSGPWIYFQAGPEGLAIQAASPTIAVEYQQPGELPAAEFCVPLSLLAECEGRDQSSVLLETTPTGCVTASWTARGIPQQRVVEPAGEKNATFKFPARPAELAPNSQTLLAALAAAAETSDSNSTRYTLNCIQLRGSAGKIAATDGKQLLVQAGYTFPWPEDLLVPRPTVLAAPEILQSQPVCVGRTEDWVCITAGPWSIHLMIDKQGRFPRIDDCIPRTSAVVSRLQLDEQDARFLASSIGQLPGGGEMNRPLILDLNGQVILRARSSDQSRPTEVVLSASRLVGDPICVGMDRRYLARAVELGFRELQFTKPHAPALCDNGQRQFVWAMLSAEADQPSGKPADQVPIRIESSGAKSTTPAVAASAAPAFVPPLISHSTPLNQIPNMTQPTSHSARSTAKMIVADESVATSSSGSPIEQAVALRESLRDTLNKSNQLIHALKQQKRQSKLVAATLASLKQLQAAG